MGPVAWFVFCVIIVVAPVIAIVGLVIAGDMRVRREFKRSGSPTATTR